MTNLSCFCQKSELTAKNRGISVVFRWYFGDLSEPSKHADEVCGKECTSENTKAFTEIHVICRKKFPIQGHVFILTQLLKW